MRIRKIGVAAATAAGILLFGLSAYAGGGSDTQAILDELQALRARIEKLENNLQQKDHEIQELRQAASEREESAAEAAAAGPDWLDRIEISGAVEVEFGHESRDLQDPGAGFTGISQDNDDIVLATAELGVDAQVNPWTQAHVLLLYEDDDTDPINIDEATILLGGTEDWYGLYVLAGRYYPHFGELNSWMVSDPLTLEVFEMQEAAVEAGYDSDWITVGAGVFHGDIEEGEEDESRINGFFADASFHNPEGTLGGLSLLLGVSYLNDVADSDTLQEEVQDLNGDGLLNDLRDQVGGFAAYAVAEYDMFGLSAEYITATDHFLAGEMGYAVDRLGRAVDSEPAAWNLEFAVRPLEPLQLALRYGGTDDLFGLFPESQWGATASWAIYAGTTLSAEYLRGSYDEDNLNGDGLVEDDANTFTLQLAVEF